MELKQRKRNENANECEHELTGNWQLATGGSYGLAKREPRAKPTTHDGKMKSQRGAKATTAAAAEVKKAKRRAIKRSCSGSLSLSTSLSLSYSLTNAACVLAPSISLSVAHTR